MRTSLFRLSLCLPSTLFALNYVCPQLCLPSTDTAVPGYRLLASETTLANITQERDSLTGELRESRDRESKLRTEYVKEYQARKSMHNKVSLKWKRESCNSETDAVCPQP